MSGITISENIPSSRRKLSTPRRWKIVFLNDDHIPTEFIVQLLLACFRKTTDESIMIIDELRDHGRAVVGVYSFEVAESKLGIVAGVARVHNLPLRAMLEPE
jgi:ATP-dependent Clp protease adaptor protein ClpS